MDEDSRELGASERAVLAFTLAYIAGFFVWFLVTGNHEFIWYIATMVLFVALAAGSYRLAHFPPALLWALSLWGLAHMAGGGAPVGDGVLYGVTLVPLYGDGGDFSLLKYDQVVHAYGFGVTTWLLWHLMQLHHPDLRGGPLITVLPVIGAMGLGSLNEIIEFIAVLTFPDTGVGGYYNTALDLVFNAIGAVVAMAAIRLFARGRAR